MSRANKTSLSVASKSAPARPRKKSRRRSRTPAKAADLNLGGVACGSSSPSIPTYPSHDWNHTPDHPDPHAHRSSAYLGPQQKLGLCTKRRPRTDRDHSDHPSPDGEDLVHEDDLHSLLAPCV